jgi:mRNA interferase RelE/StbE
MSSGRIGGKEAKVPYKIELETGARREYRDLAVRVREQVTDAIDDLQTNPCPPESIKLVGASGYRVRTGDYRILYTSDDSVSVVRVYRIGRRRNVYR